MICLHCGYCCKYYMVVIVDDPEKGIVKENLISNEGNGNSCKHLRGKRSGEYSCAIHHYPWYKDTPCFAHGQIEISPDCVCRLGEYILKKRRKTNDTTISKDQR